jgi:hypothetical protein
VQPARPAVSPNATRIAFFDIIPPPSSTAVVVYAAPQPSFSTNAVAPQASI